MSGRKSKRLELGRSMRKQNERLRSRQRRFEQLEKRELLAAELLRVTSLYASSDQWSPEYRSALVDEGQGHADFGYVMKTGSEQSQMLPWDNVNQVSLQFSEAVTLLATDLELLASDGTAYAPNSQVQWDSEELVATFSFAAELPREDYQLRLKGSVASDDGDLLDGYFQQNVSSFPSGDDIPGSDFLYRFDVLPGDANQSGRVTFTDMSGVRTGYRARAGEPTYEIFSDFNGSGRITFADMSPLRSNYRLRAVEGSFAPVVSGLSFDLKEDNSIAERFFGQDSDGDTLSFSLSSESSSGVLELNDSGDFTFTPETDFHGTAVVALRVLDASGVDSLIDASFNVAPVNDAPVVITPNQRIALDDVVSSKSLALHTVFNDVDGDDLGFTIASSTLVHGNVSIAANTLLIDALDGFDETATVSVQANDGHGGTVQATIRIDIDRSEFVEVDTLTYSLVSDQVIEFGGSNVFYLATNLDSPSQLRVVSADNQLIDSNDVTIEKVENGRFRVTVRHTSELYGVNSLLFMHGDRVASEVLLIVTPPDGITLADIGTPELEVTNKIHPVKGLVTTKVISSDLLPVLLGTKAISVDEAFSLLRVVSPEEAMQLHAANEGVHSLTVSRGEASARSSSSRNSTGLVRGRVELRVESDTPTANGTRSWKLPDLGDIVNAGDGDRFVTELGESLKSNGVAIGIGVAGITLLSTVGLPVVGAGLLTATAVSVAQSLVEATLNSYDFEDLFEKTNAFEDPAKAAAATVATLHTANAVAGLYVPAKTALQAVGYIGKAVQLRQSGVLIELSDDAIRFVQQGGKSLGFGLANDVYSATANSVYLSKILEGDLQLNSSGDGEPFFTELGEIQTGLIDSGDSLTADYQLLGESLSSLESLPDSQELGFSEAFLSENSLALKGYAVKNQQDFRAASEAAAADPARQEGSGPGDPIDLEPDTVDSDGENGKETSFFKDSADVKATFESAKSIYDIAKTVQAIAGNIDAIFSSTSENAGSYQDLDGQTYNLFDNQVRIGSGERDNITSGEGNDIVLAYGDDDRINTSKGDDKVDAGGGRNNVLTAGGDDKVTDGNSDSFLSVGAGDDVIRPGGGNDFIDGGLGHDVIIYGDPSNSGTLGSSGLFQLRTYDSRDIGNDILFDPTKSGEIHFRSHLFSEMSFRKDRNDLEIILPSPAGETSNTLKFQSFFANDAAGWTITDQTGQQMSLYDLTGRITSYEALQSALLGNESVLPSGFVSPQSPKPATLSSDNDRFSVRVAIDNRLETSSGLLLSFDGNKNLENFVSRNEFASLTEGAELLEKITAVYPLEDYETITIVGHGEGGLIAQWVAAAAATRGPAFVNTYLINTPDISGLISQVARADFPEYAAGFPELATHYLVEPSDWVSRLGIWAGNDETYASWKAFSFDFDADRELPIIEDLDLIQAAHRLSVSQADFVDLTFHQLELATIRGHVSLMQSDDFSTIYANDPIVVDGVAFDSTTNPRQVFFDESDSQLSDIVADTTLDRTNYLTRVVEDPRSPDRNEDDATIVEGFSLSLDFQTKDQGRDHLAPYPFAAVNETTLFTPGTAEQLTYGWEQLQTGVSEGADQGRASALERDFVNVSENTFIVEVPEPGIYNVAVTFGDREIIRESLQVFANGYAVDRVSTMPGDYLTRGYQINTLDTQLRLTFVDRGGRTNRSAINGIVINQVQYRDPMPVSEALQNDPSIIVMAGSYELPESNGFIDTLEQTIKQAAILAANAFMPYVGGALMSVAINVSSGQGFGLGTVFDAIGGALAKPVGSAISLVAGIPQNFVSDPTARGILAGATSIGLGAVGAQPVDYEDLALRLGRSADGLVKVSKELGRVSSGLSAVNGALTVTNAIVQASNGGNEEPEVDLWMYDAAAALAQMSQQYRLGKIDAGFDAIDPDDIIAAIQSGKTPEQLLRQWKGTRDFLVLDWLPEGVELTDVSESEHEALVRRGARASKQLLESYLVGMLEEDPDSQLDLLFVSHGAAYDLTRETIDRLNTSEHVDALDFVKVVTLDPVSLNSKGWFHPEMTSIVSRVDNVFQTEDTPAGALNHFGRPLDGRIGGGAAGFFNRQARVFDLESSEELLRFRHWDTNSVELSSAELTDIEFSSDGSLIAASGKDGTVTVRYVDDQIDDETGEVIASAGTPKFEVWGQDSKVRSLAFVQMELDGEWKDYLLTISAANDPTNQSISKNKILLTDLEDGSPVWQGKDVKGTQVEASPSGNVIVSADANGHAKVWVRNEGTLTFDTFGNSPDDAIVEAHPGQGGSYIADLFVINDRYFVTAGLNDRMKLFQIGEDEISQVDVWEFNNPGQGKVRNLDYDPYNGLLAVGSGQELSIWKFDQGLGTLIPLRPANQPGTASFARQDHVDAIQGIQFSKPSFLLDDDGRFVGDRFYPGTTTPIARTDAKDIDIEALDLALNTDAELVTQNGLKLASGGEDRTLIIYSLDRIDVGDVREESVLSGSMLPIRELAISADGTRVAVVGQDNVDDNVGGPIRDIDVTKELDGRLGWQFSEIFLQGRREHNSVPTQWIYDVVEESGESYFWLRNANNTNRPGSIDKSNNFALPPNKRGNAEGVDVAPIDIYVRPGESIDIKPLQYLIEVDREDYAVVPGSLALGFVMDADGNSVGEFRMKQVGGEVRPNVLVFEANSGLDFSEPLRTEYSAILTFEMIGPEDSEGVRKRVPARIDARIINHKPVAFRDVVELHPSRSEIDFRPRANDYDFDNDVFALVPFPTARQDLTYAGETVATVRRTPQGVNPNKTGIDIEVTVTESRLTQLLDDSGLEYLPVEFEYTVKEAVFSAESTGIVEVRLGLQKGPENLRADEVGADQFLLRWDPVPWSANKYVIERFDENAHDGPAWVKHSSGSDVSGNQSDQFRVKDLEENKDYWFRVVAKNTNADRVHASYEGADTDGAFHIKTPVFAASERVTAEALGATKVEIQWAPVFWSVDRYLVELYEFTLDSNGEIQRASEPIRNRTIDKGDGTSTVFKGLTAGTAYLPVVIAKNEGQAKEAVAEFPVRTSEKDIPNGIDLLRLGPKKIKVSWATTPNTDRYRIVAIDPRRPLEEGARKTQGIDAKNGNTNEGVLEGLSPEVDYLVIVEGRGRNGKWTSLLSASEVPGDLVGPTVLSHGAIDGDPTQIDLSLSGSNEYLIEHDFSGALILPSVEGLSVDTEFRLTNLSMQPVPVFAAQDESLTANQVGQVDYSLPAIVGQELEEGETGIVVYNFISTASGWLVELGDNTTEAIYIKTPTYLAAEPGSLTHDIDASTPRRPKIVWQSPFWDARKHKVEIALAAIDDEGVPLRNPDGSYRIRPDAEGKLWLQSKIKDSSGSDSYTFTGMEPFTDYIVRLTTTGSGQSATEELHIVTESQSAPGGVEVTDVTLDSLKVKWTEVAWEAQRYRVVLREILGEDANGDNVLGAAEYTIVSAEKRSKVLEGLDSGIAFEVTVEAESNYVRPGETQPIGWVPNTEANTREARTLTHEDLNVTGFVDTASRNQQIDVGWNPLGFEAHTIDVEYRKPTDPVDQWQSAEVSNLSRVTKTLQELERNQAYVIRLKVGVQERSGDETTTKYVYSDEVPSETKWGIQDFDQTTIYSIRLEYRRLNEATKYEVHYYLPGATETDSPVLVDKRENISQNADKTRYVTIEPLAAGTTYLFKILGLQGSTILTESDFFEASTVDPVAVTNSDVPEESRGRTKVLVTWDHPTPKKTIGYHVRASVDDGATWLKVRNSSGTPGLNLPDTREQFEIAKIQRGPNSSSYDSLELNTEYLVQIEARYETADSQVVLKVPLEEPLRATTKDRVAATLTDVEVLSATNVKVVWTHDADGIEEFVVQKRQPGANSWNDVYTVSSSNAIDGENAVTLSNVNGTFIPQFYYEYRVKTVYPAGPENSNTLTRQMLEPAPARNLRVTDRSHTSISVRWDTPNPNWELAKYEVQLSHPTYQDQSFLVDDDDAYVATFDNLVAGQTYTISVVAKHTQLGNASSSQVVVSEETQPYQAPSTPTIVSVDYTSAHIAWTHSDPVSPATEFSIYRDGIFVGTAPGGERTFRDTGLQPGQSYRYVVRAVYADGEKPSGVSAPADTTPAAEPTTTLAQSGWKEMTVSWIDPGWGVSNYSVVLWETSTGKIKGNHLASSGGSGSIAFGGLNSGTSYTSEVTAFGGGLILSSRDVKSTDEKETPVLNSVIQNGNFLTFKFSHLVPSSLHGDVKLRVERRKDTSTSTWKPFNDVWTPLPNYTGELQFSFQMNRTGDPALVAGVKYRFRLIAEYLDGSTNAINVEPSNFKTLKIS